MSLIGYLLGRFSRWTQSKIPVLLRRTVEWDPASFLITDDPILERVVVQTVSGAASLASTAPPAVGATGATGTGTRAARNDHTHAHGSQAGGTLHAAASDASAGFMSASDKAKLDGLGREYVLAVGLTGPSSTGGSGTIELEDVTGLTVGGFVNVAGAFHAGIADITGTTLTIVPALILDTGATIAAGAPVYVEGPQGPPGPQGPLGATGPTGPASTGTTTVASFVIPNVGANVTIHVVDAAWMAPSLLVYVIDGVNTRYLYGTVVAVVDSTHVTVANLGDSSALGGANTPGLTIASGSNVALTGLPGATGIQGPDGPGMITSVTRTTASTATAVHGGALIVDQQGAGTGCAITLPDPGAAPAGTPIVLRIVNPAAGTSCGITASAGYIGATGPATTDTTFGDVSGSILRVYLSNGVDRWIDVTQAPNLYPAIGLVGGGSGYISYGGGIQGWAFGGDITWESFAGVTRIAGSDGIVLGSVVYFEPKAAPAAPFEGCVEWVDATSGLKKIMYPDGIQRTVLTSP